MSEGRVKLFKLIKCHEVIMDDIKVSLKNSVIQASNKILKTHIFWK